MSKIIEDLKSFANKEDTSNELKYLLIKAARLIEEQNELPVQKDKTYTKLAQLRISSEQKKKLQDDGFSSNGMAITIESSDSALDFNNGFLQMATLALNAVSTSVRENIKESNLPPEISTYLMELGPWMQSFTNSYTIRNGGNEIMDFDIETYEKQPVIKLR
jgi:hypothetical protein